MPLATLNRALYIAALLAALQGCATNPITGREQFMMVSEDYAIRGSASAYTNMMAGLEKKKKIERGTPRALQAKQITDRLVAQAVRFRPDAAGWNWQVEVINEPKVVNAFCMAGGKMAIYTGFWERLKATDDEIAAVMGHEIGHALASHTREKMSVGLASMVGTLALAALSSRGEGDRFGRHADNLSLAAALAVTLPNSRGAETEADQIGIELAARAGFDPRAAVTLWEKMTKLEKFGPPEFLSTHPATEHRAQSLSALVPRVDPLYQRAKAGKGAEGPETMSFVAEDFERFKRGDTVFDCRFQCAFSFGVNRSSWKTLHAKQSWRDLAVAVIQVGYLSDLSYFLLAEAAKGLRLPAAARAYYARALEAARAGNGCAGGLVDSCEGFEVRRLSQAGLGGRT